jgi:hypothetical protein
LSARWIREKPQFWGRDTEHARINNHNHGGRFAPSIAAATIASEQIRVSRAKPLRGAKGALDILICSEKGWPLRSTASPNALMSFDSDHIAVLALAAVVIARIK